MRQFPCGIFLFFSLTAHALTIGWDAAPRTLDPRYAIDANSQYFEDLVNCALITYDAAGKMQNDVAKSLTWESDKVLVVELREDVRFADGKPVTAEDVKATYEFFLKNSPSPRKISFRSLEKVEALGNKVKFYLKTVDAAFTSNLVIGVLPKDLAMGEAQTDKLAPRTCGPFVFSSRSVNQIELQRNEYHIPKATLPTLTIKVIQDETTRAAKLEKGELDLIQNSFNGEALNRLKKVKGLQVKSTPGLKVTYLGLNMNDPVLKNIQVRKALDLAIDRQAIIEHLLKGAAVPSATMMPPGSDFLSPKLVPPKKDLEKAKAHLAQSGFVKEGKRLKLFLSMKPSGKLQSVAQAIASDLRKIGVDLELRIMDWGKLKADVDQGRAQMWLLDWIGFKDPDIYHYVFSTQSFPPEGGNRGRFSLPALDLLLDKGRTTLDLQERKNTYFQAEELIQEHVPYVFLFHENNTVVMTEKAKNYIVYADGRYSSIAYVHTNYVK